MPVVDGHSIARDIRARVHASCATLSRSPRLGLVSVGGDATTRSYLRIKEKTAHELGIALEHRALPESTDTGTTAEAVEALAETCDGIVVQLPLPKHIDTTVVLRHIPHEKDVDAIGARASHALAHTTPSILTPVVGAIAEIAERHHISFSGKRVVVAGHGRLVGKPAALFAEGQGGDVTIVDEGTSDADEKFKTADIIILGAGVPGLLTPAMVRDGVVVFDAGTSEAAGKLVGDADPQVAKKASLFTPVPGGIGPVAVAKLFENLLTLLSNSVTK